MNTKHGSLIGFEEPPWERLSLECEVCYWEIGIRGPCLTQGLDWSWDFLLSKLWMWGFHMACVACLARLDSSIMTGSMMQFVLDVCSLWVCDERYEWSDCPLLLQVLCYILLSLGREAPQLESSRFAFCSCFDTTQLSRNRGLLFWSRLDAKHLSWNWGLLFAPALIQAPQLE